MRTPYAIIKYWLPALGIFWLGAITIQSADRYVVPTNSSSVSPYTSWLNAATNIQTALNVCIPDDIVWVSNGTYLITNQITVTNRVTLKSANGYTNTIVAMNWPLYTNRCAFVSNGILDGFTVTNGHLSGVSHYNGGAGAYVIRTGTVMNCYFAYNVCSYTGEYSGGGGVWVSNSIVSNCVFYQNQAVRGANTNHAGFGGGIYCFKDSLVLNSTLISNAAGNSGGGICVTDIIGTVGTIIVSNSTICYNTAFGGGGGYGSFLLFNNCAISNNTATNAGGGGISSIVGGNVRNSTIANNNAGTNAGGGVYILRSGSISNCVIFGNTNSGGGAGIYVLGAAGSAVNIDACRISNNICGGGAGGGGVAITNNGQMRNCLIANNTNTSSTTGNGGGVRLANAGSNTNTAGVINCTIVNNYSTNEGGGIAVFETSNYIANCIFSGNTSSSNNYPDAYNTGSNSNNYWYCCAIVTPAALAVNQGNITSNPAFAGNWRLRGNSPCINTGTNQSWMTNSVDLDGKARIRYGTNDMGAYERVNEATTYRLIQ